MTHARSNRDAHDADGGERRATNVARRRARRVDRYASVLEKRAGRREGSFGAMWVYMNYEVEVEDDDEETLVETLVIETSWLPGLEPAVNRALKPLGFRRRRDGAFRVVLTKRQIADRLHVMRVVTRAISALLEEQVYGRGEGE